MGKPHRGDLSSHTAAVSSVISEPSATTRLDHCHTISGLGQSLEFHQPPSPQPLAEATLASASAEEPVTQDALRRLLASVGYHVIEVDRGRPAIARMPENVAVVLLNRHAPDDSGPASEKCCERGLAGLTLAEIERCAISETLHACGGNRGKTARSLGVSEKTVYNKIKSYRIRETF